jgi:hypothetical protein
MLTEHSALLVPMLAMKVLAKHEPRRLVSHRLIFSFVDQVLNDTLQKEEEEAQKKK